MKRKKPNQKKYSNPSFKPQLKIRNFKKQTFGYKRTSINESSTITEKNSIRLKHERKKLSVIDQDHFTKNKRGVDAHCPNGLIPCNYIGTNYECCKD